MDRYDLFIELFSCYDFGLDVLLNNYSIELVLLSNNSVSKAFSLGADYFFSLNDLFIVYLSLDYSYMVLVDLLSIGGFLDGFVFTFFSYCKL